MFSFPQEHENDNTLNNFDPTRSRDNPEKLFVFIGFFVPRFFAAERLHCSPKGFVALLRDPKKCLI